MAYRIPRYIVALIGGALLVSACTTKSQETPPLTGPSELGTAIGIAASPDVLAQDGASQSLITITAHDSNGQLLRNLSLRAEISVDGSITDFGSLSARNIVTDATGRAFVTYTAPPTPPIFVDAGTIVHINVTPAGTNWDNATGRFASIRLVPPGVIGAPPSPFRPAIVAPSPTVGDVAIFTANVTDSSGVDQTNQIASYAWSFGDGDTASGRTVSHTYDDPGTFSVSLTITDALGRRATVSQGVSVAAGSNPNASFVMSPSSGANVGQTIAFNASQSTATAGHQISNYSWDFGDGSSAGGITTSHAYAQQGSYTIVLTVTDDAGRTGVSTQTASVGLGGPTAEFTFSPSSPQTSQPVSFDASASRATTGRSIVSYAWSFDDGSNGSGVTTQHTYSLARSYVVSLTVTDNTGQRGTTTRTVTVGSGNPTAAFNFSPSSPLAGTVVTFDASTSTPGVSRTILTYRWNFDDGSPVVTTNAPNTQTTHTFATTGSYQVLLTVTDDAGQTGQVTRNVSVGNGAPTASFTNSPTSPFAHDLVQFDGRSSTAAAGRTITGYAWTFGDGGTGTGATTSHPYATPGTYTVRLTVTDNTGQTGTTTSTVNVQNDALTGVNFSPTSGAATVNFTATATSPAGRPLTYSWNFGDPASGANNTFTGTSPTRAHTFTTVPGTYTVTLTVTDSLGQTATVSLAVNIS